MELIAAWRRRGPLLVFIERGKEKRPFVAEEKRPQNIGRKANIEKKVFENEKQWSVEKAKNKTRKKKIRYRKRRKTWDYPSK